MTLASSEFLYVGFVLPMLFALTLVGEGIYKIAKNEEGYLTFILGIIFLIGVVLGYIYIFSR
ncbi:hypothetical protein A2690_03355 [Candidatus Roizmanbacteria bacterium RIFCSPHIGHO2_01_FULL_39_12b]|uniref:Uncharacterized protein n=1 Tax=Candidatus Roizmanbacteria bacterium RIFCSPHIGHO2_01_FULL_39_12b TaxID=1802030 RepID=A0A1F7GCU3_9BACT|nr:MAG: hypothetical protein A2690_03355 [Candidatus Roizmanbacteria bacterium RIFCSPHIGHO2_01_FULL_39_12b]OGK46700.1 MAG: hypothetical protein A3B46_02605 [Candidatus Roizmanbacteria bacterium RIFCSPLOWO2_01_FULL_39_19]